tara:strand:- start:11049 stop:12638 length:1590 start_codon:yes stop_codon:yes gene_type:complete
MKYINFKRFKILNLLNNIYIKIYSFSKFYKYFYGKSYRLLRSFSNINLKLYNPLYLYKKINLKKLRFLLIYIIGAPIIAIIIYLIVPIFYKYDKSKISNLVCADFKIQCTIKGEVKYSLFPTPRLKINNMEIKNFKGTKKVLAKIKNTSVKISIHNLYNKKNFNFNKININEAEINLNYKHLKKYKNLIKAKLDSNSKIYLKESKVNFFDNKKKVVVISDINSKYKSSKNIDLVELNGKLVNEDIYINFKNEKDKLEKTFTLKLPDSKIFAKIETTDSSNNAIIGKGLIKKGKNRITSIFNYKNDVIEVQHANLKNDFLDGKFKGSIRFLPYFGFDIDMTLNTVNFNRLYSSLNDLQKIDQQKLFKINKKLNGKVNLSADKIFSKHTLINSFESRLRFINGNILIEQFLFNLGKLGAADLVGVIKNDVKFSNLKFENNIFLDNLKKFYNKFGVYNKEKNSSNIYIEGNFDLVNLNLHLHEITTNQNLKAEDVSYIEKEFNNIVLENGYETLFDFKKLKEFVKTITEETN